MPAPANATACAWLALASTTYSQPRVGLFYSRKSRRNGPWILSSLWTPGPSTTLRVYTLHSHSPSIFLVSLFVSLVLCDTAAGGVEAAVNAHTHICLTCYCALKPIAPMQTDVRICKPVTCTISTSSVSRSLYYVEEEWNRGPTEVLG